ncbi:MAG: Cu(I)-responsive transcriptional regulator [Chromatiales bacterium]|jgi:MerR family copper efflux transcriptional regulator|nr:Cu(I)-responsive transcriptional regulator [Chromatiales bacterium]
MNISRAAELSGVSAKMIRHYESAGLIPAAGRTDAGYRVYAMDDVHRLAFIRRARAVGFGSDDIRQLLSLWQNRQRPARDVKRLAVQHLQQLQARIVDLEAIADTLSHLIGHCHGDERPDCPILDSLAADSPAPAATSTARRKRAK